jgi:hypothetical protein
MSKSLTVEAPSRILNVQMCRKFLISNNDDATKSRYSECQDQNSEEMISRSTHILFLRAVYLARADRMSLLLIPSRDSMLITLHHGMLLNVNKI